MDLARVANPLQVVSRAAFAVVVLAALVVDVWLLNRGWFAAAEARWALLSLGAIASVGLLLARWPAHALAFAVAASGLSLVATAALPRDGVRIAFFTEFVVLPVLLAAVLAGRGRTRWPVAGLLVVAAELIATRTSTTPVRAVIAMSMLVALGLASAAVVYVRLRDSEKRMSMENARHHERLDIARELHDLVGHHVTGIVVLAQASRFTSGAEAGSPADRAFAEIEAAGSETLTSLRRLIGLLRTDPSAAPAPRLLDIERVVDGLRTTHPSTDLIVDDKIRTSWVPPDLAHTIQRLVQEAATNVRRHGDPASRVRFTVANTGATIELTVENHVLHPATGVGFGIVGMRERVDALGGAFTAGPSPDGQWVVRAALPILAPER